MLKKKVFSGVVWSMLDSFSAQIVNFIIGIILARLLTPEEFGLIGMITIFIAISQILINGGIKDALIREKKASNSYYNTAFLFNAFISVCLYIILFISAPFISDFYNEPQLTPIVRLISFTLIINACTLVQRVKLIKKIDFKSLMKVSFSSSLISGLVAITLAYMGYGVWSLIWKNIIASIITLVFLWKINNWIPKFNFDKTAFKSMFGFGSRLMILGLIDTTFQNIYYLVIGKYYSATQLGFYTRADAFKRLPAQSLTSVIQKVSYPTLSKLELGSQKIKDVYIRITNSTLMVSVILMFFLASISEPLVLFLLGEKWALSAKYLSILCFAGIFFPNTSMNYSLLKVYGKSSTVLNLGIAKKVFLVPVVLVGIFIGMEEMLYSMVTYQVITYFLNSYYGGKEIQWSLVAQVKSIGRFFVIGLIIFMINHLYLRYVEVSSFTLLILCSITSAFIIFVLFELLKFKEYLEIKKIILNTIKK